MHSLDRCTAQTKGGQFCDAPSMEDAPFPICERHAFKVWTRVSQLVRAQVRGDGMDRYRSDVETGKAVVYYVDRGDRVKIGFTRNLPSRLASLMATPEELLAVEPGPRELEQARHRQFAHCRIDHREFFAKTPELMAHVVATREAHGLEM